MLRYMERSTIYYLKQKGWSNVQIAAFTGHHRDTIARVLREEVEKKPKTRERISAVAVFDAQIREWLEQGISVILLEQNVTAALDHAHRAYIMRSGRVILEEPADEMRSRGHWWDLF